MNASSSDHHLILVMSLLLVSGLWLVAYVAVLLIWWRDRKAELQAIDLIRKTFLPIPHPVALAAARQALEEHKE